MFDPVDRGLLMSVERNGESVLLSPEVSVCVPTYRYGKYLTRTIESVLSQTLQNWELVICDDCSSDGTEEICREYARKDPRVKYFLNDRRLGMFGNFRRTVEHSRAPFIKFLCADDWMHPECLEVCLDLIRKYPSSNVVQAGCLDVDKEDRPIAIDQKFPRALYRGRSMIFRQMCGLPASGGNSSYFIRKSAYYQVGGFDPSFPYSIDIYLVMCLCRIGDVVVTNRTLFYGRQHEDLRPHRAEEDMTPYIGGLELPRWVLRDAPLFGGKWWLKNLGIGRAGTDTLLLGVYRIIQGRLLMGMKLVQVVLQWGNPWWPILVAIPWRFVILGYWAFRRRMSSIPKSQVWKPKEPGWHKRAD